MLNTCLYLYHPEGASVVDLRKNFIDGSEFEARLLKRMIEKFVLGNVVENAEILQT